MNFTGSLSISIQEAAGQKLQKGKNDKVTFDWKIFGQQRLCSSDDASVDYFSQLQTKAIMKSLQFVHLSLDLSRPTRPGHVVNVISTSRHIVSQCPCNFAKFYHIKTPATNWITNYLNGTRLSSPCK